MYKSLGCRIWGCVRPPGRYRWVIAVGRQGGSHIAAQCRAAAADPSRATLKCGVPLYFPVQFRQTQLAGGHARTVLRGPSLCAALLSTLGVSG